MIESGWIKIHRDILEKPSLIRADYLGLWVYLLASVNYTETREFFAGKEIKLNPGQGIFSTPTLSKILDLSVSKVRRILETFENEQRIEQRKSNQGTVISIVNWDKYQQREQPSEQRVNNERTTSEQRVNNLPINNKKDKKDKKDKNIYGTYQNVRLSDDEFEKLKTEFPLDYQDRIERLSEYIASTGKKYKDFLATIRNWARRDKQTKPHSWNDPQAGYQGARKLLEGLVDEE